MKAVHEFKIVAEYSCKPPNWKPMARAFARAIEEAIDADGTFKDLALEAEFQEWMKERREKDAGRMDGCEDGSAGERRARACG